MLELKIPETELWNEEINEFVYVKQTTVKMEHSLVSVSKWEQKFHKSYLSTLKTQSTDEIIYYWKMMTITQNVDPNVYVSIASNYELIDKINKYINDPMTATTFLDRDTDTQGSGKDKIITSEQIYYWMLSYNIPVNFEKWHLNRLLTLIRVFEANDPNRKQTKLSKDKLVARYAKMNAERRKKYGVKG